MTLPNHRSDDDRTHFYFVRRRHENIESFDVPVDDASAVHVLDAQQDLVGEEPDLLLREVLSLFLLVFEHLVKVTIFCVLHQDV